MTDNVAMLTELAIMRIRSQQFEVALPIFRRLVELQPGNVEAMNNLGSTLLECGRLDEAVSTFKLSVGMSKDHAPSYANLGKALCRNGCVAEGIEALQKAVDLAPGAIGTRCDLGVAFIEAGRLEDAMAAFAKAIHIDPREPAPHVHLAFDLLLKGEFENGWKELDWRLIADRAGNARRSLSQRRWLGESLEGKSILLWAEQGYGDAIQFVRYAEQVKSRGATVLLECSAKLRRLFNGVKGIDRIVITGGPLPPFDVHCPLMSLPRLFETRIDHIPNRVPYLKVDKALVEQWRRQIVLNQNLQVGLAWSGEPRHARDRSRSLKPHDLLPLADLLDVDFYSLQPDQHIMDGPLQIRPLLTREHDFADTAAAMMNMDLIISADTAPLHLAGALAKPAWGIIQSLPDFRWLLDRQDSPWYPTVRLFRQSSLNDWRDVIWAIKDELASLIRSISDKE